MLTNDSLLHDRGAEVAFFDTFGVYDMQVPNTHRPSRFENPFKYLRTRQCADQIDSGSLFGPVFIEGTIQNQRPAVNRLDPPGPCRAIKQPYLDRITNTAPKHIKHMPGPLAAKTVSPIALPITVCKYQQVHFI
jgi:hypothetical protein